jgi:hypothetical protein
VLSGENGERNHRGNRYKRIVLFGETFIASVQIEEAKLSHANLPRSEYENLESDLRGGGKRLFFEVPSDIFVARRQNIFITKAMRFQCLVLDIFSRTHERKRVLLA